MPIAIIAVVVIALIGAGAYFFSASSTPEVVIEPTTEVARTDTTSPTEEPETDQTATGTTEDEDAGVETVTYTGSGTYLTPARTAHDVDVTLTLAADGTIIDAAVEYDKGDGYSNPNQERFDNAYQTLVIGQNIADVELSAVGGASLTSEAFNDAVAEIEAQRS